MGVFKRKSLKVNSAIGFNNKKAYLNKDTLANMEPSIIREAIKDNKCPQHAYPLTHLHTKSSIVGVFHNTLGFDEFHSLKESSSEDCWGSEFEKCTSNKDMNEHFKEKCQGLGSWPRFLTVLLRYKLVPKCP